MTQQALPLQRFKVLDLSRVRAGPVCVRQLADWGADVIKIERPPHSEGGDEYGGDRNAADFQNLHRNKRSMTLDLKSKAGRDVFFRLVEQADVVVENYRPDVKNRLGIDYDSLAKINPRIILGSISGFGQDGPYASRPGVDQIAQGMSGFMSVTGVAGQGPMRAGAAIGDVSAGLFLACGLLTALLERETTGRGQWVHTSLLEALISVLDFQAAAFTFEGRVPGQAGNDHPSIIPMGAFHTSDGYINIGAGTQTHWRKLCALMGVPDMAQREGFVTVAERKVNRVAVNAALSEIFATRTNAEWVEALNAEGIPCGPIYGIDEMFGDPQVVHLGMSVPVSHPRMGERALVGQPIHMSRTNWTMRSTAPEIGADTEAVLAAAGYSAEEIAALTRDGVV